MSRFLLCAIVILFLLSSVKGQRVVIVGAGVSGLSAAKRLCDFNLCNITILEALDRIGGRLFTDDYHGHKLEMGAQYIQCVEENPVYQFLSKYEDLSEYVNQTTEGPAKLNAAYISGKTITANITELLRNSFGLRKALNDYVRHKLDKEKMPEITLQNVSIFDVVNSIWRNEYEQDNNADEVLNVFLNAEDTLNAANTWVTGVLLYQYYKMFDAPGVRLHSGYSILLNHLQRYLPESSIKLKKSVGLINWNYGEKQATPVVVEVSAADGTRETLPADYVIFTPSLGYLKYAQDFIFAPGLPQNKKNALKTIGFGTVNKLFLYYENKFWNQGDFPLYILWDNSTADDDFADPPNHWIKYVYIFYEYDDSNLLIWLNETASLLISDRSKLEISSAITQLLRRLLADNSIPAPDDVIVTHWEQEANFRGSYSFTSVGESGKVRNILSDPLSVNGIPRVLFAGEATHSSRFATIDGAFASGIREADRIIALHNSGLCTTCNSSVIVIAMIALFLIQYM